MISTRDTFLKGETVMWRGSWGNDAPEPATIKMLELCPAPNMREGIIVDEAYVIDKNRLVVTLDNGCWAYGFQIDKMQ